MFERTCCVVVLALVGCGSRALADGGTDATSDSSSGSESTGSPESGDFGTAGVCGDGVASGDETCDDGNDVNDDGCSNACVGSGQEIWRAWFDGVGHRRDGGVALAVSSDDHIFVLGREALDGSATRLWLGKYDPSGALAWSATHGNGYSHVPWAVAVANDGSAVVLAEEAMPGQGWFEWMRKYDGDGAEIWTVTGAKAAPRALVVDQANQIFVIGAADDGSIVRLHGPDGAFVMSVADIGFPQAVARLDDGFVLAGFVPVDGDGFGPLWARSFDAMLQPSGLAVDGGDTEYTAVAAHGTSVFVGAIQWVEPSRVMVVTRYDASSARPVWAKTVASSDTIGAWATDGAGNLLVCGGMLLGQSNQPFVRKYGPDGEERWTWFASVYGHAAAVAVDSIDNAIVTGYAAEDTLLAKIAP